MGPVVVVLRDAEAVAGEAAARIVGVLSATLVARGEAHLVLTGGSSAIALYRALGEPPWRGAVDWRNVHFWWGDERFVPRDHPESNAGLAYRTLIADPESEEAGGLTVDATRLHPMPAEEAIGGGRDAQWAADEYARRIAALVHSDAAGSPVFDVVLLGVGTDGHVLSAFPGDPALAPDAPIVLGVPAPTHVGPHLARVTLATRVLPAARHVMVMASGEAKANVVAEILRGERDAQRLPAQLAALPNATWLLDEAAAANLA